MDKGFEDSIIALQPQLKRFAFSLVKDSDLADDLVQDTLYRSLKFKNKWDATTNLKAWMFTILKNSFINDYRKIKKSCIDNYEDLFIFNTIPEKGVNNPESSYSEKEILAKIEQLKDAYKIPFKMFIEGYKYEEIAEKLNVKMGTIKSRMFFARKELMNNLVDNQLIITTMNDIAKQRISDKLTEALEKELVSKNQAGPLLGVKSPYLSLVTSRAHWKGCPESAWEELLKWVNTGLSIKQYGEKKKIIIETISATLKEMPKKPNDITAKDIKSDPKLIKEAKGLQYKTGTMERLYPINLDKKLEPRPTNGQMIDFMLAEKKELTAKIEAIDVLLKHYIS